MLHQSSSTFPAGEQEATMVAQNILLITILLAVGGQSAAFTLPDQATAALAFRDTMVKVGPAWIQALSTWHCPTPAGSSNGSCDPCAEKAWWGNFEHLGCRGRTEEGVDDILGGDGYVTNIHITDLHLEGSVPQAMCNFKYLKEFDLDGGSMTGTIPQFLTTCFPELNELDLSYNQLTGTLPAFLSEIASLTELEVESNLLVGTIPSELGKLKNLTDLKLENNNFEGSLPATLSQLNNTLKTLLLYNNQFEGALDMFSSASSMQLVSLANNPKLCGMIPASLRWSHGYNPRNTSLGQPCS